MGCVNKAKRQKHVFPDDADARIAEALTGAVNRKDYTARLDGLVAVLGLPRALVARRAAMLGVRSWRVMWSEKDRQYLRDHAGVLPIRTMARALNRNPDCVQFQLRQMQLSGRTYQGYSMRQLAPLLGVGVEVLKTWRRKLWLIPDAFGFYTQECVETFLRTHLAEVRWRWADTIWITETLQDMLQRPAGTQAAPYEGFMAADAMARRERAA